MSQQTITIEPVTRIEGHARIVIFLDRKGDVADCRLQVVSLRGFEQFVLGRAAEEIPRIVTRICGICPWMHHLASVKAVEQCFGVTVPATAHLLREFCLHLAHINDKILHFFFLAAPDFLEQPETSTETRSFLGLAHAHPDLAEQILDMRRLGQQLLAEYTGKAIHPVAAVPGGFSRAMSAAMRERLHEGCRKLLDFSLFAWEFARATIFPRSREILADTETLRTGFLGTVDSQGNLRLYEGILRLMRSDGSFTDFPAEDYASHLREHVVDWSFGKMVLARHWPEEKSKDFPWFRGLYRVNTLARLNVCDSMSTPKASAALEEFRTKHGRPAQDIFLFHQARLIELIYCCERCLELLEHPDILDPDVRSRARAGKGQGIGHVEAPRGTLIHEYETDASGCITRANMIVGTTHNLAPMQAQVHQAARRLIQGGRWDDDILNRLETAVRAYDP